MGYVITWIRLVSLAVWVIQTCTAQAMVINLVSMVVWVSQSYMAKMMMLHSCGELYNDDCTRATI